MFCFFYQGDKMDFVIQTDIKPKVMDGINLYVNAGWGKKMIMLIWSQYMKKPIETLISLRLL